MTSWSKTMKSAGTLSRHFFSYPSISIFTPNTSLMENKPKRSASKKLLYIVIILLLFFILVEVILSVFLYHKHGNEPLATIEALKMAKQIAKGNPSSVNVENQKLIRPGATE